RRLAVVGAGARGLSQGLGLAVQIVATVTLARLLTPADFGVVTWVATFCLFLINCGLNGFITAVLQCQHINDDLASNLFWVNVCAGFVFALGLAAAGSTMAHLYGNPLVARVAIGVAPTILIASTSVLHTALLMRAMRFSVVSANDV